LFWKPSQCLWSFCTKGGCRLSPNWHFTLKSSFTQSIFKINTLVPVSVKLKICSDTGVELNYLWTYLHTMGSLWVRDPINI
jgi:hypothetical protein